MESYVLSAVVTVLSGVLLFGLSFRVGLARSKGHVQSYETYTTTDKAFIIANRVHMNTLESLIIFLPFLWIATLFSPYPTVAALIGGAWLLSRTLYAVLYVKDPKLRFWGFLPSIVCLGALAALSLYGLFITW